MITALYIYCLLMALYVINHYCYRLPQSGCTLDSSLPESARTSLIIIIIILIGRATVLDFVRVPTESMLPTIEKQTMISYKPYAYGLRLPITNERILFEQKPKRGDVVLLYSPRNPYTRFVKRIVGVPGDTIELVSGRLHVNGKQTERVLIDQEKSISIYTETVGGVTWKIQHTSDSGESGQWLLEQGQYFVLGDNRNNSRDSRFWGPILDIHLIGKVTDRGKT